MKHEKLLKTMLEKTTYSGSLESKQKHISASSFNLEPMQLYLRYKYGDIKVEDKFNESSLGSIFQLGIDSILNENNQFKYAIRREITLDNNWSVSGEIDASDEDNKYIYDFKLLNQRGYDKSIKKQSYISNMSIYKYLFQDYNEFFLFAINKQGKSIKSPIYSIVDITDKLWSWNDTEKKLLDITNNIESWIKDPDSIPECNIWEYGKDKHKRPAKCSIYCSWSKICPTFQSRDKASNYHVLKNLL